MENYKADRVKIYVQAFPVVILNLFPSLAQIKLFCLFNQIPYLIIKQRGVRRGGVNYPFIVFRGQKINNFLEIVKTLKMHFRIPNYEKEDEIIAMTNTTNALFDIQKFGDTQYYENAFKELPDGSFLKTKLSEIVTSVAEERSSTSTSSETQNNFDSFRKFLSLIQELTTERTFLFGRMITTADITVYTQVSALHEHDPASPPATLLRKQYPSVVDYMKKIQNELEALKKR